MSLETIAPICKRCGGSILPLGWDGEPQCLLCSRPLVPYVSDAEYIEEPRRRERTPVFKLVPAPVPGASVTCDDVRQAMRSLR